MKFKFKNQQYQADASDAVVNCFLGQTKGFRKEVTERREIFTFEIFSNKKLELSPSDLLKNIQDVQKDQGLKTSSKLDGLNYTVEMETGTGKTYVYTKTIYELNREYGWSKFIVMVPSVAIREGVHKSLEITAEHFQEQYGKKIRFFIYNTKNKSNLVNIKNFGNTSNIEVIIINYQAFNVQEKGKVLRSEAARKIYQKLDALQSERPIDIIKRARPILIIDEPQKFGAKAEKALNAFYPLFILRYSATHKKEYNKVYMLDAIDAYNQKLVKKINVKGIEVVGNSGTNSYLYLDSINISKDKYPTANIELEKNHVTGPKKTICKISEKSDLYQLSGELIQYKGFIVKEINGLKNKVTFTRGIEIYTGQSVGDVDKEHVRRIQIREAIRSHIEKEKIMYEKGIKVLSLFFIDEVAKYKKYDTENNSVNGEYADIFEKEYEIAVQQQELFNKEYYDYINKYPAKKIHNGYFSIDKKGKIIDSKEKRGEGGSDDVNAYDLIMKNKEKLLSFKEPTRFIFSHSALREGWDNPNIFQICTLKHSQSNISKRQEIGRGLRICVDKNGERMDSSILDSQFFDYNTLTVIASESYDNFAKVLQKEIVDSLSERPVELTPEVLVDRVIKNAKGDKFIFNSKSATQLIMDFNENGYIDSDLKLTDKLIEDIEKDQVILPDGLKNFKEGVYSLMKGIHTTANFKATENDKANNISEAILKPNDNFAKKEFQELWNKIKVKTLFEVDFDSDELISKSIDSVDKNLRVKKILVNITTGEQKDKIDEDSLKKGTSMTKQKNITERAESILGAVKYDLIGEITKGAKLTRKTVVSILQGLKLDTFENFKSNPENFIKEVIRLINNEKAATLINNITYSKTDKTYTDEVFTVNNFKGSLGDNILKVKKHVYDYVKTDSKVERKFAEELEAGEIAVYAKLPSGFKIPTPVGNYNPDWAIVFDKEDVKYVYFIAETKGSMESFQRRGIENKKIDYAKKHFEALGHSDIKYDVITTYQDLKDKVM